MTPEQMSAFLERTRQAILLTTEADGRASGVPVWFDWDGETVRIFSGRAAPKVKRIEDDPRISVLVTNDVDEAPAWVSFDGRAHLDTEADAKALAVDVLAPRYWDLDVPGYREVVDQWAEAPADTFVVIRLDPERIRSSA
ncbi:MAG: pyridoxamine 5'-phosphate oxidase family protein [Actinomycetota bacterium]